jgi:hypothetical protein
LPLQARFGSFSIFEVGISVQAAAEILQKPEERRHPSHQLMEITREGLLLGAGTIVVKYPGQPRVPKGNGRLSGQWTSDGASESDGFIAAPEGGAGWEPPVMEQMPRLSS